MSILILLVFLLGAVLGMRFKVLILVSATGFALIAILVGGFARGDSVPAILMAVVLAAIFLQIGYVGGIVTKYSIALTRAGRVRRASLTAGSAR